MAQVQNQSKISNNVELWNDQGWKCPLRSSPAVPSGPPLPHVPRCHIHMDEIPQGWGFPLPCSRKLCPSSCLFPGTPRGSQTLLPHSPRKFWLDLLGSVPKLWQRCPVWGWGGIGLGSFPVLTFPPFYKILFSTGYRGSRKPKPFPHPWI